MAQKALGVNASVGILAVISFFHQTDTMDFETTSRENGSHKPVHKPVLGRTAAIRKITICMLPD
jgi:hypothetical protein